MNFRVLILGLLLAASGILLIYLGPFIFSVEVGEVERGILIPESKLLVGDVTELNRAIDSNVRVSGFVRVKLPDTGQVGEIDFYVADEVNFQRWLRDGKADFIFERRGGSFFNFSFRTEASGIYHFIFDNRHSIHKKDITFASSFERTVLVKHPDERITYLGWGIVAAGTLLAVYGIAKKEPIPWA